MEKFHTISDAAKQLSVETHVLRYWEEELGLHIHRNAQGHRFYVNSDIALLRNIKDLKDKGFQLKAIKLLLPDINNVCSFDTQKLYHLREELNAKVATESMGFSKEHTAQVMPLHPDTSYYPKHNDMTNLPNSHEESSRDKLRQFEEMLHQMISSTLVDCMAASKSELSEEISTRLLKEIHYISRQQEDLQEQQLTLLHQILAQVRNDLAETAVSREETIPTAKSKKTSKTKERTRKKLFAKSR